MLTHDMVQNAASYLYYISITSYLYQIASARIFNNKHPTRTARKWGQKCIQNATFAQGQRHLYAYNAYR